MAIVNKSTLLPPKPEPKPGKVKVVRALYKYDAQYPDELSFQEGDLLYVFDQTSSAEWWKARCGKHTGLIPSNYVENLAEEVREPLHEAARRGNINFLQECISQGVSVTGLDTMGNTALYWASHSGHIDCLELLLKQTSNPPVNAQNHFGDTPLHISASRGHTDIVELLLKNGADSNILNNNGETAIDLAMDLATKNLIQMKKSKGYKDKNVSYTAEDYGEDDSD